MYLINYLYYIIKKFNKKNNKNNYLLSNFLQ